MKERDSLGNFLLIAPVRVMARAKGAQKRLNHINEHFHADACDPIRYACRRCHTVWDDTPLREYEQVTCSNCYSENVLIVSVRLMFRNWGRWNGGKKEQLSRYKAARAKVFPEQREHGF